MSENLKNALEDDAKLMFNEDALWAKIEQNLPEKAPSVPSGSSKIKKFNFRVWALPAAALLCIMVAVPVLVRVVENKSEETMMAGPMKAATDSAVSFEAAKSNDVYEESFAADCEEDCYSQAASEPANDCAASGASSEESSYEQDYNAFSGNGDDNMSQSTSVDEEKRVLTEAELSIMFDGNTVLYYECCELAGIPCVYGRVSKEDEIYHMFFFEGEEGEIPHLLMFPEEQFTYSEALESALSDIAEEKLSEKNF